MHQRQQPSTQSVGTDDHPKLKRRQRRPSLFGRVRDRGFAWVGGKFNAAGARFGFFLNQWTRHWTRRQQRLFLVLFVIGTQLMSFSLFFYRLKKPPETLALEHGRMSMPIPPPTGVRPQLTPQDTIALAAFRARLDSLMATSAGRDSVAAFNRRRPGFIDSVLELEQRLHR